MSKAVEYVVVYDSMKNQVDVPVPTIERRILGPFKSESEAYRHGYQLGSKIVFEVKPVPSRE